MVFTGLTASNAKQSFYAFADLPQNLRSMIGTVIEREKIRKVETLTLDRSNYGRFKTMRSVTDVISELQ